MNSSFQLDDDLRNFVNKIEVNIYNGKNTINLIDLLPVTKSGICISVTMVNLTYLYQYVNKLLTLDDVGSIVDTTLRKYFGCKRDEISHTEMVRLIFQKIQTNQTIDQHILRSEEYITQTICDFKELLLSGDDFYCIMQRLSQRGGNDLILKIREHPKANKFLFGVLFDDVGIIKASLNLTDARSNNNKAYIISLQRNDDNIINILENSIILRMLLHLTILRQHIQYEDLVRNIYSLMVRFL